MNKAVWKVTTGNQDVTLTLRTERHEKIKLDRYGDVRSLKLEPVAVFNGIFVRKGRMWTWISEDERRLCTQASVAVPVARVHVRLHRVEGPGDDFWRRPTVAERKD